MTLTWSLPAKPRRRTGRLSDEKRILGRDIRHQAGQVQLLPGGDYSLTEGVENLRAAIMRLLITSKGDFATRPDYGIGVPDFIAKPSTQLGELRSRIIDGLAAETRIDEITDLRLEREDFGDLRGIRIYLSIKARGKEERMTLDVAEEV